DAGEVRVAGPAAPAGVRTARAVGEPGRRLAGAGVGGAEQRPHRQDRVPPQRPAAQGLTEECECECEWEERHKDRTRDRRSPKGRNHSRFRPFALFFLTLTFALTLFLRPAFAGNGTLVASFHPGRPL